MAGDLVAKLVRRHPHVFAGADAGSAAELNETWERQKVAEKGRTSVVDGVPLNQPALALAGKLVSRAARARPVSAEPAPSAFGDAGAGAEAEIGARLLAVVTDAVALGVDAETALRRAARAYRQALVGGRDGRGRRAGVAANSSCPGQ